MVNSQSDANGSAQHALRKYYRRATLSLSVGIVMGIAAIFVPGRLSGVLLMLASVMFLWGGLIAMLNVAGVAAEYGAQHAQTVLSRWPHGSVRVLRGTSLGRIIGFGFVVFALISGVVGIAIVTGGLQPPRP